jgi:hypothetical protein
LSIWDLLNDAFLHSLKAQNTRSIYCTGSSVWMQVPSPDISALNLRDFTVGDGVVEACITSNNFVSSCGRDVEMVGGANTSVDYEHGLASGFEILIALYYKSASNRAGTYRLRKLSGTFHKTTYL